MTNGDASSKANKKMFCNDLYMQFFTSPTDLDSPLIKGKSKGQKAVLTEVISAFCSIHFVHHRAFDSALITFG